LCEPVRVEPGRTRIFGVAIGGSKNGRLPYHAALSIVMAGLVTASRVYPTCDIYLMRKSGKPDFRCHPRLKSLAVP
jgi:hypothetical protein